MVWPTLKTIFVQRAATARSSAVPSDLELETRAPDVLCTRNPTGAQVLTLSNNHLVGALPPTLYVVARSQKQLISQRSIGCGLLPRPAKELRLESPRRCVFGGHRPTDASLKCDVLGTIASFQGPRIGMMNAANGLMPPIVFPRGDFEYGVAWCSMVCHYVVW